VNSEVKQYFEAAALGNGKPLRFVELAGNMRGGLMFLHFLLIAAALNFPVMAAISHLAPWELFSRLYGSAFGGMLPEEFMAAATDTGTAAGQDLIDSFNLTLYSGGYGAKVLLPFLALCFGLILILQTVFYLCGAFCLGLTQMTASYLPFKNRLGVFIMASTIPAAGAALFGLLLPAVHIIVFYLAVIPLVFALVRRYNRDKMVTVTE
jgi:hypothetical protein